jgi:tetratricopeptide (TPR) repeat protein
LNSNLNELERQLKQAEDTVSKAEILIGQGDILKKLKKFEEAEDRYDESLKLLNTSYGAIKGKIDLYLKTKKSEADLNNVVDDLFQLDPTNPTVCQDIFDIFSEHERIDEIFTVMDRKINDYSDNKEAQGNINYHLGLFYSAIDQDQNAAKYFSKAKDCFAVSIDPKHEVFKLIEENLRRIEQRIKQHP